MNEHSMLLFARPSFLEGVGRIMDFGGTLNEYNYSLDGAQADRLALMADMQALRADIAAARQMIAEEAMGGSEAAQ